MAMLTAHLIPHKAGAAFLRNIRTTLRQPQPKEEQRNMTIWEHITVFGGLPFTGLLALAIACSLLVASHDPWRVSACWCGLFLAVLGLAAASQVAFLGWGVGVEAVSFAGFSGHASRAAAVFPVALFVLLMRYGRRARALAVMAGCALALLVAVSRVQIGAHSVSEAGAGFLLGAVIALLFIGLAQSSGRNLMAIPLFILCLATAVTTGQAETGTSSMTHQWLVGIALNLSGRDRPYSRTDWKLAPAPYVPPCAIASIRLRYLCM